MPSPTLRQIAALATGSTLVMFFLLPIEMADPEVRPGMERASEGARRANGTPVISFFTPAQILTPSSEAVSAMFSTFRPQLLPNDTLLIETMGFALRTTRRSC